MFRTSRLFASSTRAYRAYATQAAPEGTPNGAPKKRFDLKDSNLAFYLLSFGVIGIGTYVFQNSDWARSISPWEDEPPKSPFNPQGFVNLRLKKVEPYNHNTSKFVFELPNNLAARMPVASCLVVKSADPEALKDAKGKPIIRPYTPISPPDHKGELTLMIKRYEKGNASKYIHGLKPGDLLSIKGPISKFPYKINDYEEVVLIGGGAGITPLYQVADHALKAPNNRTKFTLLFANVTEEDILLREEFDAWKKKYPGKFDVVYVLDKPPKGWTGSSGYISKELIEKIAPPPSLDHKLKIFICGPPPQVASLAGNKDGMKQGPLGGVLKELGYTEDQVFKF